MFIILLRVGKFSFLSAWYDLGETWGELFDDALLDELFFFALGLGPGLLAELACSPVEKP